jgi:Resolvase, N terminal domain
MTKCIIYARYSPRPGEPEDILSNEKQIDRCREYAGAKGYEVAGVYQDSALTGLDELQDPDPVKAVVKRAGLLAAIKSMKKGYVLLIRWRNRLARDPYIQAWVRRTVRKQGGTIEATDEYNEQGLAGELVENTLATFEKYRAIQIAIDTGIAMRRHQNVSHRLMTRPDRPPFGWRTDPNSAKNRRGKPGGLVPDIEEQKTKKVIVWLALEGHSLRGICQELDRLGLPRRGKTWKGAFKIVSGILKREQA